MQSEGSPSLSLCRVVYIERGDHILFKEIFDFTLELPQINQHDSLEKDGDFMDFVSFVNRALIFLLQNGFRSLAKVIFQLWN